jgi:pimeloyl-ACP methyl ester carboxylesterase
MSTYVLIHGAWHGSWCWKRVRKALHQQGHEVFTPTLTGLGERSHLLSQQINLETHITDVLNLIKWEELSDVILCGHSYGGAVISGAADRIANKISALVYVDAFVLDNGQTLNETVPAPMRDAQIEGAKQIGDGWKIPPIPGEIFQVNAKDLAWMNSQCTPQPLATFEQPLKLTGEISKIKNVTCIFATGWPPSPFAQFHEKAKSKNWRTLTTNCGHDVMLDLPEELTRELTAISARPLKSDR